MKNYKLLLTVLIALLTASTCFAQTENVEVSKEAMKAKKKAVKLMTKRMGRVFKPAQLTDDQQGKMGEIIDANIESFTSTDKAIKDFYEPGEEGKIKAAFQKAREMDVKWTEKFKLIQTELGMTDERWKEFRKLDKAAKDALAKIKMEISNLLTDEQKAAMPAKSKQAAKKERS